jgi:hypothetical protein
MSSIPSDIKSIDAAREWCRVNGYSEEQMQSMVASWSGLEKSAPASAPIFIEEDVEEDWEDDEDLEEEDEE